MFIPRFALYVLTLCVLCPLGAAAQGRTVAITLDDLLYTGADQSLERARYATDRILAALAEYDAPASAFVTGVNVLVPGQSDARIDLLRRWREAGVRLENHGYAHRSFNRTPAPLYLDDVAQGMVLPELVMREHGDSVRYFRAPYNQTGPDEAAQQALLAYLEPRGLRLAPFTVEHADYAFDAVYTEAIARGDTAAAKRIGQAYETHLDTALAFAEQLSVETFGREIPQVFLIHSNRLNADYLGALLRRLEARGYTFTSFEEALQDPAYRTPDGPAVPWGISWLHRWRAELGLPKRLRDEPDPPEWITKAYQELAAR